VLRVGKVSRSESSEDDRVLKDAERLLEVLCKRRKVGWEAWHKLVSSDVRREVSEDRTEGERRRSESEPNGRIRASIVTRSSSGIVTVLVVGTSDVLDIENSLESGPFLNGIS
jgi:hypothetical protein